MDLFFYILELQHLLAAILSLLSLYFSINFLRKYFLHSDKSISSTMLLNFAFIFVFSIISLTYYIYLFVLLREEIIYDAKIVYTIGLALTIMVNLGSLIEFFLCIDRCLAIIFSLNYSRSIKATLNLVAIIAIIVLSIFIIFVYKDGFPITSATTCRYFGCLLKSNSSPITLFKIILIFLNFTSASCLALLIRIKLSATNHNIKKMNKTVLSMVLCTTFIEFIPFAIAQGFLMIYGIRLASYVGPYAFTVSTINITLSAGIYYRTFQKYFISNITVVTTSMSK